VTKDVPDYAFIVGVPGKQKGWMSRHGHILKNTDENGIMVCPESGLRYKEVAPLILKCLDIDEDTPLPPELSIGKEFYKQLKQP
jgi:UDP-2-acetamido-3-amino-2,3-dideoxy-glucuronate N-acetyltransferase